MESVYFLFLSPSLDSADTDECEDESNCIDGKCMNTYGSYQCFCTPPLVLAPDSARCILPAVAGKTYINCNKVLCIWKPYNTLQNPYSLKPFTRKTLTLKPLKSHFKSHTLNFKSHCLNQCFPILEAPRAAHIGRLLLIHLIRSLVKFSMTWIQCVRLVRHLKSALLGFHKELDWDAML